MNAYDVRHGCFRFGLVAAALAVIVCVAIMTNDVARRHEVRNNPAELARVLERIDAETHAERVAAITSLRGALAATSSWTTAAYYPILVCDPDNGRSFPATLVTLGATKCPSCGGSLERCRIVVDVAGGPILTRDDVAACATCVQALK